MIEPEIAFATLKEDMDLQEEMIKYILAAVLEEAKPELEFLNNFVDKGLIARLESVRDADFARVSYTEAWIYSQRAARNSNTPCSGAATCRPSTSAT